MTPVELLQKELKELERSLEKSTESYRCGNISYGQHFVHRKNLEPKIKQYKQAIEKLSR